MKLSCLKQLSRDYIQNTKIIKRVGYFVISEVQNYTKIIGDRIILQ